MGGYEHENGGEHGRGPVRHSSERPSSPAHLSAYNGLTHSISDSKSNELSAVPSMALRSSAWDGLIRTWTT